PVQLQLPAGIANVLSISTCACSSRPCSTISPGLLIVSEIVTALDEERTAVVIRSMILFWNRAASSCMPFHRTVAPASICLLVSGCWPGLLDVRLVVRELLV